MFSPVSHPALNICILTALFCVSTHAQNLLHNPQFDGPEKGIFVWNQNQGVRDGVVKKLPGEGPEGEMAVQFTPAACYALKQGGIRLIEGEKYRMGAWVRTKDLKSTFWLCALVVYNYNWQADQTSERFPENTDGKWVRIEKDFVAPQSPNGTYTYSVYASTASGTIDVASPYLLPLTEKAKAESKPPLVWEKQLKRITPYYPRLSQVSCDTGEIRFCNTYPGDKPLTDYICRVSYATEPPRDFPFDTNGLATALLGKLPEGPADITVQLVHKATGQLVFTNTYPITAVKALDIPGKRLNNLVVEFLRKPLTPGKTTFTAPEDAWYRITLTDDRNSAAVTLDGDASPIIAQNAELPHAAAMRFLERGTIHTLDIAPQNGADGLTGELVITRIPQLIFYPLIPDNDNPSYFKHEARANQPVLSNTGMFDYDLDFCRKVIWPNFNTCVIQNSGIPKSNFEKSVRKAFDQWGIQAIGCNGFPPHIWADGAKMAEIVRTCPHVRHTDGRCLDEIFSEMVPEYTLALSDTGWNLQNFDKIVHTWAGVGVSGYFRNPPIHRHMLASMTNISRGKGKILLETYAVTTPDTTTMEQEMDQLECHLTFLQQILPDAAKRVECIIGGYFLQQRYCTDCYPQTDPKVFYDRYFQTIATRTPYRDLAGIGCYCFAFLDEENARWIAAITKHYGIDGRTDLLSDAYGFKLNPGHIVNPDFLNGLDGWNATPAEPNAVQAITFKGFGGKKYQHRLSKIQKNCGDSCVQFTRSAKAPNLLTQTITGLTPGKLYSLSFTSADPDALQHPTGIRQPYVLTVTLDNADQIPELGHIFNSVRPDRASQKPAELVTQKIVFCAKATDVKLTFSDWIDNTTPGAPTGQKRIMNFIAVRPYFAH